MKLLQEDPSNDVSNILLHISHQLANQSSPALEFTDTPPAHWAVLVNFLFIYGLSANLLGAIIALAALHVIRSHYGSSQGRNPKDRTDLMDYTVKLVYASITCGLICFLISICIWMWQADRVVALSITINLFIATVACIYLLGRVRKTLH